MILPIYTYGQPVLRKVAEDIDREYPQLDQLIQDMYDTLDRSEGIGLAAPQVGYSIRLVDIWNNLGYCNTRNSFKLNRYKKI